jgi:hypothetical protein
MEKRSRRRIHDLVAPAAFQGLSQNEIGCARISMTARSTNAPFKVRIQKRKTNHLQIITFGLQRAAGPYESGTFGSRRAHSIMSSERTNEVGRFPIDYRSRRLRFAASTAVTVRICRELLVAICQSCRPASSAGQGRADHASLGIL